jgi:hypothetical protein
MLPGIGSPLPHHRKDVCIFSVLVTMLKNRFASILEIQSKLGSLLQIPDSRNAEVFFSTSNKTHDFRNPGLESLTIRGYPSLRLFLEILRFTASGHQPIVDCGIERNGRVYLKEFVQLFYGLVRLVQYLPCPLFPVIPSLLTRL